MGAVHSGAQYKCALHALIVVGKRPFSTILPHNQNLLPLAIHWGTSWDRGDCSLRGFLLACVSVSWSWLSF
jgi:hypothetical protein